MSMEVRDMIKRILIFEPKNRLTLEEIENHPWIKKYAP